MKRSWRRLESELDSVWRAQLTLLVTLDSNYWAPAGCHYDGDRDQYSQWKNTQNISGDTSLKGKEKKIPLFFLKLAYLPEIT